MVTPATVSGSELKVYCQNIPIGGEINPLRVSGIKLSLAINVDVCAIIIPKMHEENQSYSGIILASLEANTNYIPVAN